MPDKEKVIKSIKACAHHPDHDCESCDYCDDNLWCYNDQLIEDFISLLKEQEAVEPKHNPLSPTDWFCGKCGMCISRFHDYCPSCGQAVKWDEID